MDEKYDEKKSQMTKKFELKSLERDRMALVQKLKMQDKHLRVAVARRREAFEEEKEFQKLEEENKRAQEVLKKRQALQNARRLANEQACIQRAQMKAALSL